MASKQPLNMKYEDFRTFKDYGGLAYIKYGSQNLLEQWPFFLQPKADGSQWYP